MTPLILLPGMMCDARLFHAQIDAFSRERAVMVAPIHAGASMAELAAGVLAACPPRFALAGLSMGGIVAMEMIRQAPDRVDRLALLDTNPLPEPPEVAARRDTHIEQVRAGRLAAVMRDDLKPNYLADGPNKPAILDLCMAMARDLGPEIFERQARAVQTRPDQRETLRRVAVPALVLCGEADALCPPERHRLMADLIPDASLTILPQAGHLLTLEQPAATNEALRAWLNR